MPTITVDVILDAGARHLVGNALVSTEIERMVLQPNMRKLARRLTRSMQEELGPPIQYRGDLRSGFSIHEQAQDEVVIRQSAGHDVPVRDGTDGPYSGFPTPVKTWAEDKLGVNPIVAGAIAKQVQKHGTSKFFRGYHPVGEGGFEYAEYVVSKKEVDAFKDIAKEIGVDVVSYALGKGIGTI